MPESPRLDPAAAFARFRADVAASVEVKRALPDACGEAVVAGAGVVVRALAAGGKLMLCGNGGSAADAQHLAAELVGRLGHDVARPGIAAVALTTDSSILTAWGNDVGFGDVFARQVDALGRAGDVLLAISTSGNSANVVRAAEAARDRGVAVVAFTGEGGGRLVPLADVLVAVPSRDTQRVQEAHILIGHTLCGLAERTLYASGEGG